MSTCHFQHPAGLGLGMFLRTTRINPAVELHQALARRERGARGERFHFMCPVCAGLTDRAGLSDQRVHISRQIARRCSPALSSPR